MNKTTALTTLLAASILSAGAITTAGAADGDTTATVGAPKPLSAGATAPFDAAGVKAIRRGKAIPSGYVLVGRHASAEGGAAAAGAAIRLTCPSGKTVRTLGATGVPIQIPSRDTSYVGNRITTVYALANAGKSFDGTVYAVCR